MCLLIVKPTTAVLDDEMLERAALYNSDGWGFAVILENGELYVEKGLYWDKDRIIVPNPNGELIEMTPKDLMHDYEDLEMVIHFRTSSSGAVSIQNAHPIHLGYGDFWIAHNGTIMSFGGYRTDPISDTAAFGSWLGSMLSKTPGLWQDDVFWEGIERLLGQNRVAIISSEPLKSNDRIRVLNRTKGDTLADGTWVSNSSWKHVAQVNKGYQWDQWDHSPYFNRASAEPIKCPLCGHCSCKTCTDAGGPACDSIMRGVEYKHIAWCPFSTYHPGVCRGLLPEDGVLVVHKNFSSLIKGYRVCDVCAKKFGGKVTKELFKLEQEQAKEKKKLKLVPVH